MRASIQLGQYKSSTIHRKLTREHIYPNGPQKMRNYLAEEVLDTAYQSALGSNGCKVGGAIQLVEQTAKFIANFKDPRPLTHSKSGSFYMVQKQGITGQYVWNF
jgi:hypothetical protein